MSKTVGVVIATSITVFLPFDVGTFCAKFEKLEKSFSEHNKRVRSKKCLESKPNFEKLYEIYYFVRKMLNLGYTIVFFISLIMKMKYILGSILAICVFFFVCNVVKNIHHFP